MDYTVASLSDPAGGTTSVLYVLLDSCAATVFFVVFWGAEVLEYFFSVELSWLFEIVYLL